MANLTATQVAGLVNSGAFPNWRPLMCVRTSHMCAAARESSHPARSVAQVPCSRRALQRVCAVRTQPRRRSVQRL